jgi:muconate cycloisomerase
MMKVEDYEMFLPIEKCTVRLCNARIKERGKYSTGYEDPPTVPLIVVELQSSGFSGFGEFLPTSLFYPAGNIGVSSYEEWSETISICSKLIGKDAINLRRLISDKYTSDENASGMVDCVDFALHDLVGKALNVPAYALLGGKLRDSVPGMPVIYTDDISVMAGKAAELQTRDGFKFFKIKPHADYDTDLKMMKEFASRLQPGTKFLFDANYAYKSADEAAEALAAVAPYGVFIAEDPIDAEMHVYGDTLKPRLNEAGIKLMLDEKARDTACVVEIVNNNLADVINYHANWHSGFAGCLQRAALVSLNGLENYIGSSCYMGIADAANILLASITPNLIVCEQVRCADFYLQDSVVDDFYQLRDGRYYIPDLPGLGITVDMSRLEALTEKTEIID